MKSDSHILKEDLKTWLKDVKWRLFCLIFCNRPLYAIAILGSIFGLLVLWLGCSAVELYAFL